MKPSILIWPEVHTQIGMGHLMECLAFAEHLVTWANVSFALQDYLPAWQFVKPKGYRIFKVESVSQIAHVAHDLQFSLVILNHRRIELETQQMLRRIAPQARVVVIDQLGNRPLDCDWLINTSPVDEWQQYPQAQISAQALLGLDFCLVKPSFLLARENLTVPYLKRREIVVSMGGVDRTGATLRILKALGNLNFQDFSLHFILGPGFPFDQEFLLTMQAFANPSIHMAKSVQDMPERLARAALAFSAGGNSLYEMALLGVPALVLWEDPHEEVLGRAFEKLGCAKVLGNGMRTSEVEIRKSVENWLGDSTERLQLAQKAQQVLDGQGAHRISEILRRL